MPLESTHLPRDTDGTPSSPNELSKDLKDLMERARVAISKVGKGDPVDGVYSLEDFDQDGNFDPLED